MTEPERIGVDRLERQLPKAIKAAGEGTDFIITDESGQGIAAMVGPETLADILSRQNPTKPSSDENQRN